MIYNVFGGTLSLTQSINQSCLYFPYSDTPFDADLCALMFWFAVCVLLPVVLCLFCRPFRIMLIVLPGLLYAE